jgi:hypothetical protein
MLSLALPPQPITAMLIRSPGAILPSPPMTDALMIVGNTTSPADASPAFLIKSLLFDCMLFSLLRFYCQLYSLSW